MKLSSSLLAATAYGSLTHLQQRENDTPLIADNDRFDCMPDIGSDQAKCEARGCLWESSTTDGAPWCVFPTDYAHYKLDTVSDGFAERGSKKVQTREYSLSLESAATKDTYPDQQQKLKMVIYDVDRTTVRVRITNEKDDRFKVPVPISEPLNPGTDMDKDNENPGLDYIVETAAPGSRFWVKITRRSTNEVLFDTSVAPLLFYDQFLELSVKRPSTYTYGFGETEQGGLKFLDNWHAQGMWARDNGVGTGDNLYGVQPYHVTLEEDGNASGLLFFNANAMEVISTPKPAITYRTIGGELDFMLFTGPGPEAVTQQYTHYLGRSYLFPYWSLGFQLCRYGYANTSEIVTVVEENRDAGIPYDTQYADIDYMERQLDFTLSEEHFSGLPDYIEHIRKEYNMRFILIFDPAISAGEQDPTQDQAAAWKDKDGNIYPTYQKGLDKDVYIRGTDGEIEMGKVWPYWPGIYLEDLVQDGNGWDENVAKFHSNVAFPDFFAPQTYEWWDEEIRVFTNEFFKNGTGLSYDGIWIDMNEPASFTAGRPGPDGGTQFIDGCPNNKLNRPPYIPTSLREGRDPETVSLFEKTICMDGQQYNPLTGGTENHYDMHSLYGYSEGQPTLDSCEKTLGKRCLIVSRSTYPGSQKTIGHWHGDNSSIWRHVKQSMVASMHFSLFGFSYTGPDTCGFFQEAEREMCARWMELGAFFPYSRNHNGLTNRRQDPASWDDEFVALSKELSALTKRYRMLPYLYTLLYRAHNHGDTVVRPLMNNFPADKTTWDIDEQMQWGSGVMFSPVLEKGATKKRTYFPEARWYKYEDGYEIGRSSDGWADVSAPLDVIPLYFQGGSVVPVQVPAQTTMDSRVNPLGLIVNLDKDGKASGDLYWDSGNSIDPINTGAYTLVEFDFHHNQLQSSVKMGEIDTETHENYGTEHPLEFTHFEFNGIDGSVSDVVINGEILEKSAWKQEDSNRLVINDGFVKLSIIQQFDISIVVGDVNDRIDCTPGLENIGASECAAKGCTWSELPDTSGAPWCIHDSSKLNHGYTAPSSGSMTGSTESFSLSRPAELNSAKKFSDPVASPEVTMVKLSKNAFRMKISADGRFEIPDEADIHQLPFEGTTSESDYAVEYGNINDRFFFKVSRDGKDLIDSSHGPLIFEDQYLETSFALGSYNCYGLGEHNHRRFRHSLNWQRWAMFTRDVAPIDEWNFYGAQPFFMCGEGNSFFGVYFHNSNAQEAQFSPKPAITWRSTGGIFDISVIVADSAEELVQAYTSQIIGKPFLPPRWSLGYQLSRWGYDSLDKMKGIVEDMIAAKIPFDAQYGDIDYMDGKKDFTIDPVNYNGLADFVKELHEVHNMHYIVILDPAIANINPDTNKEYTEAEYPSYARAKAANLWINNPDGTPAQAEVWPGPTLFPDFTNMNATEPWWTDECRRFLDDEGVQYDALWIDMNEPASFMTDNGNLQCPDKWSNPPFMPNVLDADKGLFWKTICMDGVQAWGKHYDVHSLYGHSMALVTDKTLKSLYPDKRSFILTRSQFAGTGRVAGHWLGDNQSQWRQMQWSITGMLEYSLFGFSYTGADICGFWFAATAPMCQRWQQLGAFYPYSRNHNGIGWQDQHPTMFGDEVIESSRNALLIRYSLLPTLYTLMYESNQFGTTTVRSLMAEFPLDRNAADCSDQFLWGSGFMIAPVMEEHAVSRAVYFPADASWYDYHSYEEVEGSGKTKLIQADMMTIPLFARGGAFLTSQSPEVTTVAQRYNPITVTYFMDKINPTKANEGGLFWDDGESLLKEDGDNYMKFNFNPFNGEFTSTCTASRCVSGGDDDLEIEKFVIVGVDRRLSSVLVNGQQATSTFEENTVTIDLSGITISSEWSIVSPDLIQGSEDDNEGGTDGTAFLSTLTSSVITLLAYFLL